MWCYWYENRCSRRWTFLTVEGDNGAVHNITKNYSIEVGGNMDTDVTGTFRVTAKTIYLN